MPTRKKQVPDPNPEPASEPSSPESLAASEDSVDSTGTAATFASFGLNEMLLKAVEELGFEEPTPIQCRTIPELLQGRDVIAQAQTGTGKTAAFALPLLQKLAMDQRTVQALVLTPTRELAVQVAGSIYALGRHAGVQVLPIYGGQPIERQLKALRAGVHVVIGTPGRVQDHLRRGSLDLAGVQFFVLDEADEMLDMGFDEEIEAIAELLPEARQTALFSATIPAQIAALARKSLHDPITVAISADRLTVPQVQQTYYAVAPRAKLDALTRILDMETPGAAIIFCRTKRGVDEIGDALIARGYPAETIHGDLSQAMRDRVMHRFREGQAELLVATDVAARGLDIQHVSHVINFDIPDDPEQYVHRIGRTARAGRGGDAITLVAPREMRLLHEIERLIRRRIQAALVPTAGDIAARRLELIKEAISRGISAGGLEPYLAAVEHLASERDVAQVAAAALRLALERDGTASRITVSTLDGEAALGVESGMRRLFIDLGRKHGVRPSDIVGAITNEAGIAGTNIGAIDIYDSFTFVEVAQAVAQRVIEALENTTLHGRDFRVDIAKPREQENDAPESQQRRPADAPSGTNLAPVNRGSDRGRGPEQSQPEFRPGSERPDAGNVSLDDEVDDDEPPRRPPGWRDDIRPHGPMRYGPRPGQPSGPPRRAPQQQRGRGGFGPFRGQEPRETPPWQRRRGTGERPPFASHPGDVERGEPGARSGRPDAPRGGPYPAGDRPSNPQRGSDPEGVRGRPAGPRPQRRRPRPGGGSGTDGWHRPTGPAEPQERDE